MRIFAFDIVVVNDEPDNESKSEHEEENVEGFIVRRVVDFFAEWILL